MFCTKCGSEIMDGASFCSKCGYRVGATATAQTQPQYKKCSNCGTVLPFDAPFCTGCGGSFYGQRKKDSTLSILSCVFAGISFFAFGGLALIALILGLADVGINDKTKRHIGSIFGIILGVIYVAWWVTTFSKYF